jgi:hypothetical protein
MNGGYIRSSGLWGIESDSGDDYFKEVALEQLDELENMLQAIGIPQTEVDAMVPTWASEL